MDFTEFKRKCEKAAEAIHQADVLLLVTGAGWSADSGLPVFADVANNPAYQKRGLIYSDISQPSCLKKDPELFYGFWGAMMNEYRATTPHDGYKIVNHWRLEKNSSMAAQTIRDCIEQKRADRPDDHGPKECVPYDVSGKESAGAFFSFTSNCDAHFYDYIPAQDIHDCHGNIELWQCSNRQCDSGIWRAPTSHTFIVNPETMTAPPDNDDGELVLETQRPKRPDFLKNMPPGKDTKGWALDGNWPKCGYCQSLARPAIFMFGDFGWKYDTAQSDRWDLWKEAILEQKDLRLCIVEVGCGSTVATCRSLAEQMVLEFGGSQATLVRINPDEPFSDDSNVLAKHLIPIESGGLKALQCIDKFYTNMKEM